MRRFAVTISLALSVLCAACADGSPYSAASHTASPAASAVPTVTFARTKLRIGEAADARVIDVDVAVNSEQSARGLGYRDALAADAGMIFDLHSVRTPWFWMKGMRFALDMVWIGDDRRVVSVTTNVPAQPSAPDRQLTYYSPSVPIRYVLELNGGAAASLGLTPGVQLSFALP